MTQSYRASTSAFTSGRFNLHVHGQYISVIKTFKFSILIILRGYPKVIQQYLSVPHRYNNFRFQSIQSLYGIVKPSPPLELANSQKLRFGEGAIMVDIYGHEARQIPSPRTGRALACGWIESQRRIDSSV